ncbi:MAG: glycosyltransferase family 2 protein [Candidatus Aenigmarchaeota archaeon]|nr:glycosyltransferase family 2 protein [Candidatus Aenigmarchaeota archaeon]
MTARRLRLPKASVIVATYNNKEALRRTVAGLLALDYPSYEVIVVDDGSTDGTAEMIRKMQGITAICLPHGGVCKARNAAIRQATGKIVVNMDHDCVPARDWLRRLVAGFGPGVGVVSSYGYYGGTSTAFRKDLLDRVGGYDEAYGYYREDADLSFMIMDLGYTFELVEARYDHDHRAVSPRGFRAVVRYAFTRWRYHMNDVLLFKKHPRLAGRFLDVKFGFLVNPLADFKVATGLWNRGTFSLSSPRGMTFMENRSPLHGIAIFLLGLCYVVGVKSYRLRGSLKFGRLLI